MLVLSLACSKDLINGYFIKQNLSIPASGLRSPEFGSKRLPSDSIFFILITASSTSNSLRSNAEAAFRREGSERQPAYRRPAPITKKGHAPSRSPNLTRYCDVKTRAENVSGARGPAVKGSTLALV